MYLSNRTIRQSNTHKQPQLRPHYRIIFIKNLVILLLFCIQESFQDLKVVHNTRFCRYFLYNLYHPSSDDNVYLHPILLGNDTLYIVQSLLRPQKLVVSIHYLYNLVISFCSYLLQTILLKRSHLMRVIICSLERGSRSADFPTFSSSLFNLTSSDSLRGIV